MAGVQAAQVAQNVSIQKNGTGIQSSCIFGDLRFGFGNGNVMVSSDDSRQAKALLRSYRTPSCNSLFSPKKNCLNLRLEGGSNLIVKKGLVFTL